MRILAVRGENLASLAEPFALELTKAPLDGSGLFALTGPVGAGKSTILDAMCLALFDRTPRLSGRGGAAVGAAAEDERDWLTSNDVRTVLRRGTAEGWAEVDFVGRDGRSYRARWSVRRARRRIDGRLQAQEISLRDLATDHVIGSGRKTETLQAIAERLGLTFDQFCRSVLLAQGDFAAFLRARPRERAELLERMTGTGIYRRISLHAFQRFREDEARLRSLEENASGLQPLEKSRRTELEAERLRADSELELLKTAENAALRAWSWHQAAERWQQEEVHARQDLERSRAAEAAAEDRRRRLQLVRAAQPLRPRLEALQRGEAALQLVQREQRLADERLNDARRACAGTEEGLAEALSRFVQDVSWLEQHGDGIPLAWQWDRWGADLERYGKIVGEIGDLGARRADLGERVAAAEREHDWVQKRAAEQATLLAAARERYDMARAAVDAAPRTVLDRRRAGLAAAGQRLAETRRSIERVADLSDQRDEARATAGDCSTRLQAAAALGQELAGEQRAAEAVLAEARATLRRWEASLDLAAHRQELVDGQPCPLCGATEHPHVAPDLTAAHDEQRRRVGDLEQDLAELLAAAGANLGEQRQLVTQRDTASTRAVALDERLAELLASWAAMRAEDAQLPADPTGDVAGLIATRGESLQRDLAALERDQAELDRLHEAATAAEKDYIGIQDQWTEVGDKVRAMEVSLHELANTLRAVATRLENAEQGRDELGNELDGALAGMPGWRDEMELGPRAFVRRGALLAERCAAHRAAVDLRATATNEALAAARSEEDASARTRARRTELERAAAQAELQLSEIEGLLGCDAAWIAEEEKGLDELRAAVERDRAVLRERGEQRRRHERTDRPELDAADARQTMEELKTMVAAAGRNVAQLRYRLDQDDFTRKAQAELLPRIERQQQALEISATLNELIGSAKGDKFQIFAQSLTMECLLREANRNLAELARRYRLQRVLGEDLDLLVVDTEMGDAVRSIHTLSGGESFLVSLALALGLASLSAQRTRVETLFIDEGFGTLDGRSLETALAALDALQATGCQVGVISHVEGFAERIGVSVDVRSDGRGRSRVVVPVG